jgi:hypothetical protein
MRIRIAGMAGMGTMGIADITGAVFADITAQDLVMDMRRTIIRARITVILHTTQRRITTHPAYMVRA